MIQKYDKSNIFNKIINGLASCNKFYEDERVLAFRDINPVAPVHILVIPKESFISFHDFIDGSDNVEHFFSVVKRIAEENGVNKTGYRLVTNHGSDSGQIVPHFHIHIIGGKKLGEIA